MAHELASLRNASLISEGELREDVAASIVAQSSPEALADQERLAAAWKELQDAEEDAAQRALEVEDAERVLAQRANGMPVTTAAQSGHTSEKKDEVTSASVAQLRFRHNAAVRELSRKGQQLQKVQREVEQRQQARLQAARERCRRESAQEHLMQQPSNVPREEATTGETASPSSSFVAPPPSHTAQAPTPHASTPLPYAAVSAAPRLTRVPARLPGTTLENYSGGAVLPSLSRVHVSRTELRARHLRYEDDSDPAVYAARLQKRRKLERAQALLLEQQQQQVEDVERAALHDGIVPVAPVAIDVDALMEEDEDVGDGIVRQILREAMSVTKSDTGVKKEERETTQDDGLTRVKLEPPHCDSGANDTVTVKQEKPDTNAVQATTAVTAAAPHITTRVVETDVTLLPGIRMSRALYERLFDYQQEGLRWLLYLHLQRSGGILGDEMGLGKTVQIAVLLNALVHSHQLLGPALIVAPMTVLRQWVAELHRWAPHVRTCVLHASGSSTMTREAMLSSVQGTPAVVVTTYAALRLQCSRLHAVGFHYLILDEGHKVSNPEAAITLTAKSFTTPHRLILTGSPIQNSLKELWCLFDFVRPGLLGTMSKFVDAFETPISESKNPRATALALATAVECARTLQAQIAPYLLRRLKIVVNAALPPRYERVVRVSLSEEQLQLYVDLVASPAVQRLFSQAVYYPKMQGGLNRDGRDSTGSLHVAGRSFAMLAARRGQQRGIYLEAFRVMNKLRQICNHADLYRVLKGIEEEETQGSTRAASTTVGGATGGPSRRATYRSFRSNNLVSLGGSAKLQALLQMLQEWRKYGHRVLVFSQTRMMLDIIENLCEQESYRYVRMDGTTAHRHRQELIDRFNEDDSIFIALLTTRVGGIGVNLVGADRVVIFDPDWNPVTDVQARERAWRIGQTREVCVYRLITSGTVEEAILRRQLAKTYVTDKVLKDPSLQRFFHTNDSFVEHFFLGAEYKSRIPAGRQHVLSPYEFMRGRNYADDAGGVQERALLRDNVHPSNTIANQEDNNNNDDEVNEPERDFGELHEIASTGDEAAATTSAPSDAAEAETSLLKKLIDGQDVVVSGGDAVARRLARASAAQAMQRVTQESTRSVQDQQKEFSLVHAAELRQRREEADRAEQRRYYEEDVQRQRRNAVAAYMRDRSARMPL